MREQYDPKARRQLRNVPHAFSHVAPVNSAFNLDERLKPARERSA